VKAIKSTLVALLVMLVLVYFGILFKISYIKSMDLPLTEIQCNVKYPVMTPYFTLHHDKCLINNDSDG